MENVIAVIDLKSFYASCECIARHLDPFETPLVCCDPYRSDSSVVMSVTPYLKKKYGLSNVCRKRDLPEVPGMIFAIPRMSYYLEMSSKVVSIFMDYVSEEDIHVYSVDESFINLGPYLNLYRKRPEEIVKDIQRTIKRKLGLTATAGIGPNMFLAKIALDNEGKKKPPYIARWDYKDVPTKLWGIKDPTKLWGISAGIGGHLKRIGIRSIEQLAKTDASFLKREFGIMGEQLRQMANGLDESNIQDKYMPINPNLSLGQTLKRNYTKEEALLLLREMNDELSSRLRRNGYQAKGVSLGFHYGCDDGGSYSKRCSLPFYTDSTDYLFMSLKEIYEHSYSLPIRGIYISYFNLTRDSHEQLTVFENHEDVDERKSLERAMDAIKAMYGEDAVLRCSSLKKESTIKERHGQIGGHRR